MKRKGVYRTLYILLAALGVGATASAETAVPKDTWVKSMRDFLPAALCRDGWYFRSCFELTASECHAGATTATAACLQQYDTQIPQELQQPDDGRLWGDRVGTCAGTLLEASFRAKRISTAKCNDPSAWK
jgi:hypothetical protein